MLNPTARHSDHYTYYHRGQATDAQPQTEPGFVLMGGGRDVDDAFVWMAEKSGGGDFLVLRGSGGDDYQEYIDNLAPLNSVETLVIKDRQAAFDDFVLERVKRADAIFLAGGDQWNYVDKWRDSPLLDALNGAILKGVPIGGTSAGLAVLGEHLFSAEKGSITTPEALSDPYHQKIALESDFLKAEPLAGLITDSHFSERDRMGRLVTFMARLQEDGDLPEVRGVGVDERTAVLLEADGRSKVVGEAQAHWVRSYDFPETCEPDELLTYRDLEVTSVGHGQEFDLSTWSSPQVDPEPLEVVDGVLQSQQQ